MKKTLYLFDAMALIYRSYYALNKNPRINSKGQNTSAILGFINTFYDIIKKQKPTHVGVAFDLQGPTFRHEKYELYKANRDAMPEDIQFSIPIIKKLIEAFNVPILSCEGYEADDVIGTLAKQAEIHDFNVYMVTPDKDFAQLVSPSIFIYKLGRMGNKDEILGVTEVIEKFSIQRPDQVKDILGLWGDSSDNIPGIPGIGEKKAKMLIQQFDSVENLIANADKITNEKLSALVKEHADKALFSKELAIIETQVPIPFDEAALQQKLPDPSLLKPLLDELEFRTFAKRIFTDLSLETPILPISKNPEQISLFDTPEATSLYTSSGSFQNNDSEYIFVDSDTDLAHLEKELSNQKEVAFYILYDEKSKGIKGLSFCISPKKGYFVSCISEAEKKISFLKRFFNNSKVNKITFDVKTQMNRLAKYGISITSPSFDVLLAHYLLEPEMRHELDLLSESILHYTPYDELALFGKQAKGQSINYEFFDKELVKNFLVEKADILIQLKKVLEEKLKEKSLQDLFYQIEMPLVDILFKMEQEGVCIDKEYLKKYSLELQKKRTEIEEKIFQQAGEVFNIASPKQLGDVIFGKMQIIKNPPKTATKQFSTSEDVLLKLVEEHPIVKDILEYRSLSKLINTYLEAFPLLISNETHRIHTTFNQAVTATGRLSSNNPNLQNIPIKTEMGREIRKAFIPRDNDHILISADYSQIELRIIASLSGDKHMTEAFINKIDIHTATASRIFNVSIDEVTKEMRRKAKSVNFGIIYGISSFGLSEQLQIPKKEASTLISEYFTKYPDIEKYIQINIAYAKENGYAKTMLGRRRYLPDINSRNMNLRSFAERNAVNMPIQGSAADMIKIAMIAIDKALTQNKFQSKMILQVHDELVFDVLSSEKEAIQPIILNEMSNALPIQVPIEVEIGAGNNWLEAH